MVVRHRLQQRRAERVVVRAESSGDDKQNTQLVRLFKSGCEDAQRNNVNIASALTRLHRTTITWAILSCSPY